MDNAIESGQTAFISSSIAAEITLVSRSIGMVLVPGSDRCVSF
jgi:hypothetical protein